MGRLLTSILAFFCLSFASVSNGVSTTQVRTQTSRVQEIASEAQAASQVPAIAIVVVSSKGIIGTGTAGFRKAGDSQRIKQSDAFHLGSVTKPITATLIGKLVEERKLTWETTPVQVFPEWKEEMDSKLRTITIAQILAHQAGLA